MATLMTKVTSYKVFNTTLLQNLSRCRLYRSRIGSAKYRTLSSGLCIGTDSWTKGSIRCYSIGANDRSGDVSSDQVEDKSCLFVRGFTRKTSEEDLWKVFPNAVKVYLPIDSTKRRNIKNKRIAFVQFETAKEVEDLISKQDSIEINGKVVKLDYYGNTPTAKKYACMLHFECLSTEASADNLKQVFPEAVEIHVPMGLDDLPAGSGYIRFESPAAARDALERHKGVKILGKTLVLNFWNRYKGIPPSKEKDVEALFIRKDVQAILSSITGFDHKKLFKLRNIRKTVSPEYKLFTEAELTEYEGRIIEEGKRRLQMPPYLKETPDIPQVLAENPEIKGFLQHKYVFCEISKSKNRLDQNVVVREPDGTLRLGNRDERARMMNIFYPSRYRYMNKPRMFETENMKNLMERGMYYYILERACVQFEPERSDFIQICHTVYEHVDKSKAYDALRSTRFFGPMAYHLTLKKRIDGVLVDMIDRGLDGDAAKLVRLYHIVHPDCKSAQTEVTSSTTDNVELIREYLEHDAVKKKTIKAALKQWKDSQQTKQEAAES